MPKFETIAAYCIKPGSHDSAAIALQYLVQQRVEASESNLVLDLFFHAANPAVQLAALIWLIKSESHTTELSDALGIGEAELAQIAQGTPRIESFPVIGSNGSCSIARVIVYPVLAPSFGAISLCGGALERHDHLAKLSGTGCLIGFDTPISGASWQLAALAALTNQSSNRKDLAYSGIVSLNGDIIPASGLLEKCDCCNLNGLRLIHRIQTSIQLERWLNGATIPLPILQFRGSRDQRERCMLSLQKCVQEEHAWFSYEALEDFYGICHQDLIIGNADPLPFDAQSWQDHLRSDVSERFNSLEAKLREKNVLWFYAGQISSLQFGIGALFGFKRAVVILQLNFSDSAYKRVFSLYGSLNARELKNVSFTPVNCRKVKATLQINMPDSQELGLILYLGSHNPIGEAKSYCRQYLKTDNFLVIEAMKNQGVINLEEDWLNWAQEINSLVNRARGEQHWRRIHLFQTAPTALCMALGIAIGHFLPVQVFHYQYDAPEPKYRAMYSMEQLMRNQKEV